MFTWRRFGLGLVLGIGSLFIHQSVLANAFEPPPNQDAPQSTAGGGSRPVTSSCNWTQAEGDKHRAMALAPQSFVGLSSVAQPILWLYVPASSISGIEVSVFDQELNGLAQAKIAESEPGIPGLVPLELPEGFRLSPDQPYYWSAAIICNPNRRTEDWVVGGWIRYQPLSPELTLPDGDESLSHINQQMETGYWYDALTAMVPALSGVSSSPSFTITQTTWLALLQQAHLNPNVIHVSF